MKRGCFVGRDVMALLNRSVPKVMKMDMGGGRRAEEVRRLVGGDGLKEMDWDMVVCLMEWLGMRDVVVLGRVCKSLGRTIGEFVRSIEKLVDTFPRNKLALSIWLETMERENKGEAPSDIVPKDASYSIQFLLNQEFQLIHLQAIKTAIKITFPNQEELIVCQCFATDWR
eukprot:TRINITY_DN10654_c0_g1_i2.p1 TRINITY_DN10654_c0_g1~~TRINITY_DN10654_c0_g1_i2.p1  ORF type:complete len:170 (-),score=40.04 TRINITY_DN10654_c0_g1_i2:920-1429(-)